MTKRQAYSVPFTITMTGTARILASSTEEAEKLLPDQIEIGDDGGISDSFEGISDASIVSIDAFDKTRIKADTDVDIADSSLFDEETDKDEDEETDKE